MDSPAHTIESGTIAVFGAAGNWGSRIVGSVRPLAKRVLCCDPKLGEASLDQRRAVAEADALIFAVYPDVLNEIVTETRDLIGRKMVLETTSVKERVIPTLLALDAQGASVIATHPLVLPAMPSVRGQKALLMRVGANSSDAETLARALFNQLEMIVRDDIPLERHDAVMIPQQGFLHALNIAHAITVAGRVRSGEIDLNLLRANSTANYDLSELGIMRTTRSGPAISSELIGGALRTDFGLGMLEDLQRNIERVIEAVRAGTLHSLTEPTLQALDPSGKIRKEVYRRGDIVLTRFGNLRKLSFQLTAQDMPGVLHHVTAILLKHDINLNAVDSLVQKKGDAHEVTFDFGVDQADIDWDALERDMAGAGFLLTRA